MKKTLFYACLAIIAIACTKNDNITTPQEDNLTAPNTVYASIDGQTRTELHWEDQAPKTYWSVGDKIAVFNQEYTYHAYQLTGDNITRNGEFNLIENPEQASVVNEEDFTFDEGITYAFYPHSNSLQLIENKSDNDKKYLFFTTPRVQQFSVDNSFGREASPMLAIAENGSNDYSFKNIFGYLKITLKGEAIVKAIELSGNNNESIAGRFPIALEGDDIYNIIVYNDDNECFKSITLDCGNDGVQLNNDNGVSFLFALPPTEFCSGFTIIVTDSNGLKYKISTTKEIEITKNHIKVMEPLTPVFETWPVILYEATSIIDEPNNIYDDASEKTLKGTVTYDESTGKGTISFDGIISKIGHFNVFSSNSKTLITSLTLPEGITLIGYGSLLGLTNLTSINIPESVVKIDNSAFSGCEKLQSKIIIPKGCTHLGTTAFEGCKELEEVTINSTTLTMYDSAFGGCSKLKKVTFNSNEPPTLYTNSNTPTTIDEIFDGCHKDLTIYVPEKSLGTYIAAWNTYKDKIQAIKE